MAGSDSGSVWGRFSGYSLSIFVGDMRFNGPIRVRLDLIFSDDPYLAKHGGPYQPGGFEACGADQAARDCILAARLPLQWLVGQFSGRKSPTKRPRGLIDFENF